MWADGRAYTTNTRSIAGLWLPYISTGEFESGSLDALMFVCGVHLLSSYLLFMAGSPLRGKLQHNTLVREIQ